MNHMLEEYRFLIISAHNEIIFKAILEYRRNTLSAFLDTGRQRSLAKF